MSASSLVSGAHPDEEPAAPRPSQPLRVALDASALRAERTGVGRYVEQLVAHAPPAVRYVTMSNRGSPPGAAAERAPVLLVRPTLAWLQLVVPALVAQSGARVAHFPTGRAPLFCRCPVVLTVHDLGVIESPGDQRARERLLAAPWLAAAIRRADAVVAVSEHTAAAVRRRYPAVADRVRVIHEAAAPTFHQPVPPEAVAALRDALGLGPRLWLHVGSIATRKNLAALVEAFAIARTRVPGPGPQLVLAGPAGDGLDDVRRTIRRLGLSGDVRLTGYLDEASLAALVHAAEFAIACGRHEGFGLPLLEAFAAGTPVVAARHGALPEIAGGAALLVDEPDAHGLARALIRLGGDPALRAELRARGLARAAAFGWKRAAASTGSLYHEVAVARAGRRRASAGIATAGRR